MEANHDLRTRRFGLSKSKIAAFEQCPKRLWLQTHRPELAELDEGRELRFAAGHEVGALACALVPNGIMIEAEPDMPAAIARTAELIAAEHPQPLFEATFVHDGVLVRVDIMEPLEDGGWHVAEVKGSTSRKDCYVPDLATQLWVIEENGVPVRSAAIRHIDNEFVLKEEGRFEGLLVDIPSLDHAQEFVRNRADLVAEARSVLAGPEPERGTGDHCSSPYHCEFGDYCRRCTPQPEWPISLLPNTGRKLAAKWAKQGVAELTSIPSGGLSNPLHERIRQVTCNNIAFHDREGARQAIAEWAWPRSFLDFETIAFALPRWVATRPYQQVPFQFSLHIEQESGELEHREFLTLAGEDPRRACAQALVDVLPPKGAIIAYFATFERARVKELATLFPDLAMQLSGIADRIVDLLPITRAHWYHRDQRGSWSIKHVLPTISAETGYEDLAVADGTAAQIAYLEAIHPKCSATRRTKIDADLRAYCGLDTRAMVTLIHHLTD